MRADLSRLASRFAIDGEFLSAVPYGSGHINETYAATYRTSGADERRRYIHQRINREVFRDPAGLMNNAARVTQHIRTKLTDLGAADIDRRVLTLVAGVDGIDWVVDDDGEFWRTYEFIEGATTHDVAETVDAMKVVSAVNQFG